MEPHLGISKCPITRKRISQLRLIKNPCQRWPQPNVALITTLFKIIKMPAKLIATTRLPARSYCAPNRKWITEVERTAQPAAVGKVMAHMRRKLSPTNEPNRFSLSEECASDKKLTAGMERLEGTS